LNRHVQQLRSLEREWRFAHLEVDGATMTGDMLTRSRLLIDGDRFRMESAEANYDGLLTIDTEAEPAQIDINFVEGPEAGNCSYGIFELNGDDLTLCIGLVGSSRPTASVTRPGSGHALERLRRASAARPANVTGGTPQPSAPRGRAEDPSAFDVAMTPLLERLAGEWLPVSLVQNRTPMEGCRLARAPLSVTSQGGLRRPDDAAREDAVRRTRDADRRRPFRAVGSSEGHRHLGHHGMGRRSNPLPHRHRRAAAE
jgi:uncharacterized protein (TIGR03067 family)